MSTLEATDRFHTFAGVSFCGVPCAQYHADFYVWEGILNERAGTGQTRFPRLQSIVELGTFQGGFSLYLAAQAAGRGLIFRTYDVVTPERQVPGFVQLDVFAKAEAVGEHLRRHQPLILFCDGGNKPREFRTFSPYLDETSVVAVHDYGDEFLASDVPEGWEMIQRDFCEDLGSATRFYERAEA